MRKTLRSKKSMRRTTISLGIKRMQGTGLWVIPEKLKGQ
uniref:Uncharacterized protein n=1 Tax=Rhizophora mucronata TaxID=61149 RepID=A0A2P2PC40_RHIMU